MRRKDREIKSIDDIFSVVERCQTVHVAMADEKKPYVVALNFGYDRKGSDLILYLHSACEGKKIDILRKNPLVYFQMDCAGEYIEGVPGNPCSSSWKFESVMGGGTAAFITDESEKEHALRRILQHYSRAKDDSSPRKAAVFPAKVMENLCLWKIVSSDITGKRHR
ncbi:MAG: pyridoxamine 5'-phosphate oxidase family protein [Eubacteriales bacterium]|nr:pyridoxamine 5'-phosphate oxidase family protein [Eubacteriales bacterium]